jgi:hypothetical protein
MDRDQSPAFGALPRSAKKVLAAIETEIAAQGGTEATITYADFEDGYGCSPPAANLRLLRYLKLIEVSRGQSLAGVYKIGSGWQELSASEVEKLSAASREVKPVGWRHFAERMRP